MKFDRGSREEISQQVNHKDDKVTYDTVGITC